MNIAVCSKDGCSYKGKYDVDGMMFCGYHRRSAQKNIAGREIVLPFCHGITKKGHRCKRNGCSVDGDKSYCRTHYNISRAHVIQEQLQNDCPICFNSLNNFQNVAQTHCGHLFHKSCILTWRDTCVAGHTCPVCRRNTHVRRSAPTQTRRIYTVVEIF